MPSSNPLENFDTLANGMAHAIRNPLSSILTASTLVAEDPNISEETRMLLDVIVRESRHLNQIFTDFLEYVRPVDLVPATMDIAALTQRVASQLKRDGVLREVEFQLDGPASIFADEDSIAAALRQIFLNAGAAMASLTDSDKKNPDTIETSGKINVSKRVTEDSVQIIVEDDGPGLSQRQLERGFDPFFSDTADGTGLGLPLARAAVHAANGTLTLENRIDARGARVTISFPKASG